MSKITISFLCLAALFFFSSCAATPPAAKATIVRLDDVQGLFGGQTLVIDVDGHVFADIVTSTSSGLREKRYHFKLSSDELDALLAFVSSSGISEYQGHKHSGMPDEARPEIVVALPRHKRIVAVKWDNDKDPHFDKLYARLSQLVDRAAERFSYRRQPYDALGPEFPQ